MTIEANMDAGQSVATGPRAGLTATLFTAAGKMAAVIDLLDLASATLTAAEGWSEGSVAILNRHGVRVFGILRRAADGRACVAFDDPLDGWRRERFIDRRLSCRPIVIQERIAA